MQNINRCPFAAISNIFAWECISMGVQVIPIPTDLVSHSRPFPFLCFIPIPVGFPCIQIPTGNPIPMHISSAMFYNVIMF